MSLDNIFEELESLNLKDKTQWFKCYITDKSNEKFFLEIASESSVSGIERSLKRHLESNYKFIDSETAEIKIEKQAD